MKAEDLLAALEENGITPVDNQAVSDALIRDHQSTMLMGEQRFSVIEDHMRDQLPEPNAVEADHNGFTLPGFDIKQTLDM